MSLLAAGIGLVAGGIAYVLYHLIGLFTNLFYFQRVGWNLPDLRTNPVGWWVIIIPALGGLVVGLMAKYGSDKIRGHGIPEAMEAVLFNRSRIMPRVALLKPTSAAFAIGTGGPFGAEGPIIQTGGAFGSLVGQLVHTTAAERKVLLACGAAAGMAATFSTPIAAVIIAIELLLFEFKARSFIPLVIATSLATQVHIELLGPGPMFAVPPMDFALARALPFYLLLGVICGLAAVWFSKFLYWVEDLYEKLPVDPMWWPAIGGVVLGLIALIVPRVLGVGYDTITDILSNNLTFKLLLLVMVFKALALVVTLGSGTSGGLLAPMFMSSAAMGAVVAHLLNLGGAHVSPAAFALVAMGAVFGAASRSTFAFIIFAFEITRDYNAVLPLMLVSVIADAVGVLLMRNSIMTEKLARRGLRIHAEYEPDLLQQVFVHEAMSRDIPKLNVRMCLSDLAKRMADGNSDLVRHYALPIVDEDGRLAGMITQKDVLRAMEKGAAPDTTVLDAGSKNVVVAFPDETLHEAVMRMLQHGIGRLPVVERSDPKKVVGYLGRAGVMASRLRRLEEEHRREPGWLARMA